MSSERLKVDGVPRTFDRAGWLEQLQEECEREGHSGLIPCHEKQILPGLAFSNNMLMPVIECRICLVLKKLHELWEQAQIAPTRERA